MRLIDADKLVEEIRKNDLEFMQQMDIVDCLKDIIDRQPTVTKTVEIKKIDVFDNGK
ncbi:hypothetical protein [Clostridium felsineum]|uniref:Uncharacterized protein n=1 Tax=Clostridium felsineum TaxID=36839 RepID=A0A1S8MDU0_9CLOT|nr:hypothetical protein [Clostridium felsineum]URZ06465.1 hypothetical protein CLROS_017980 [Clostridium felsineum]URZ11500.1 hypothetical protein CROST_022170 [Clostridium felsineum]